MPSKKTELNIYELIFHESVHTYANPYWLWIQINIPDERFRLYLKDICINKQVIIYEMIDPFLKKFSENMASSYYIDRLENLLKLNANMQPAQVIEVDLTEEFNFTFSSEKRRERFRKQFAKRVEQFIAYEHKNYRKILAKIPY